MPALSKCKRRSALPWKELAVAIKSLHDLKQAMIDNDEANSDSEAEESMSNRSDSSMEGILDQLLPMMEIKADGPQVCRQSVFQSPYC